MNNDTSFTVRLSRVSNADVAAVGGKNASLGEMIQHLQDAGIRVPGGFATTADAYWHFLDHAGLREPITAKLRELDAEETPLKKAGSAIRRLIGEAGFPDDLAGAIRTAYRDLAAEGDEAEPPVAVRSSATAEDLPSASFAGQQETYLNVRGEDALLDACRRCFASLFTDRAIIYRRNHGFDHMEVALSVGVQRMVGADTGGAGVMFSIDTETGFPDTVLINANWGLGETVVQGTVEPDEYVLFKPLLDDERYAVMAGNDLQRGRNDLQVYVMAEIPANVTLADEFAQRFDGFSIGSNDLTQLVLGVDRDSERLAHLFDDRHEAVRRTIAALIQTAHRCERKVGLCGQAPSDHPEFARFLVEAGIDSMSVNPDSFVAVKRQVAEAEAH